MINLLDSNNLTDNLPEFTVSDLSVMIKKKIEGEFSYIRVRGEVGRISRPASGHTYMDFRENKSVLAGLIWKATFPKLTAVPQEGLEMIAIGRLTTFPGQSRYQIIIEDLKPAGAGALMMALERTKKRLADEGIFLQEHKKTLPFLPETIGVITSASGAVIKDILHRLKDRFPRDVIIWPVTVQGEKCSHEVVSAIDGFNCLKLNSHIPRPDLLIVARGGGSIEDLWGFNEERVVRAVHRSEIPIISAIGHETDVTLIDFVADKRAPTPTAAAEIAVPVREELRSILKSLETRCVTQLRSLLNTKESKIRELSRLMPQAENLLAEQNQYLDLLSTRFEKSILGFIERKRLRYAQAGSELLQPKILSSDLGRRKEDLNKLASRYAFTLKIILSNCKAKLYECDRLLRNLSYKNTLKRGYAIVRDMNRTVVCSSEQAKNVGKVSIEMEDGNFNAEVKDLS